MRRALRRSGHKQGLRVIPLPGLGAEDVLVADDGTVYTGTEDGAIHAVDPETGTVRQVANTGGRPLGLEWLSDGRLLVCDARRGLLALDIETGAVETLLDGDGDFPMRFCNNAAVTAAGDIWFSDSSLQHGIDDWKHEVLENNRSGRLLCRRADGTVTVELEGLAFANGVALAPDETWVAVAESVGRAVVRYWIVGPRKGERDHLVADLAGFPDNIARGSDGLIWVTIGSPRDPVVEALQRAPRWVTNAALALPERLQPNPKRTVRVQAYDAEGRLVHDIDADATEFHMATGVREHHGQVWVGSLYEPAVAVLELSPAD